MLFISWVRVRFSDWLVGGYAHIFELLSVVIVTLPVTERYHSARTFLCLQLKKPAPGVTSPTQTTAPPQPTDAKPREFLWGEQKFTNFTHKHISIQTTNSS